MTKQTIIEGDCRETLRTLPEKSVQCVVTSPPYFGLRKYLPDDHEERPRMIGLESSWPEHLAALLEVFREVRRVMRDDGLLWVNYGDSYEGDGRGGNPADSEFRKQATNAGSLVERSPPSGLAERNLFGMAWRFAFAMQDNGWILRSCVIWHKKAPMPESVDGTRWQRCRVKTASGRRGVEPQRIGANQDRPQQDHNGKEFLPSSDWSDCAGCPKCEPNGGLVLRRGSWRPTTAHEYVFQFAKSSRYFADAGAVRMVATTAPHAPGGTTLPYPDGPLERRSADGSSCSQWTKESQARVWGGNNANIRSVWSLSTEPLRLKHFAAFPTKLVEPCVKASTSAKGCCPKCGAGWARIVNKQRVPTRPGTGVKDRERQANHYGMENRDAKRHVAKVDDLGWKPTCRCDAGEPVPMTVCDPFVGSGTVGVVCRRMGLNFIGCELNPEYAAMARKRIAEAMDEGEPPIADAHGQATLDFGVDTAADPGCDIGAVEHGTAGDEPC